ncbi:MAG: hypothetical protein ACLP4R_12910 [Solirubrobacteraceae bacterium]
MPLTNLVDLLDALGAIHWTFLTSGNFGYLRSVVKIYVVGGPATKGLLAGSLTIATLGAALFWRELRGREDTPAWQALCYAAAVWFAVIVMTEFFVAYQSESVFREPLLLPIATAIYIALVPERLRPGSTDSAAATPAADPAPRLAGEARS